MVAMKKVMALGKLEDFCTVLTVSVWTRMHSHCSLSFTKTVYTCISIYMYSEYVFIYVYQSLQTTQVKKNSVFLLNYTCVNLYLCKQTKTPFLIDREERAMVYKLYGTCSNTGVVYQFEIGCTCIPI